MRNKAVGIGEVLWDMLPDGKKAGGAPANFTYHVSRFGIDGRIVSAVGPDSLGQEILDVFSSKGMRGIIPKVQFPTGTVQVTLDAAGIPVYRIMEGVAWDNIPYSAELDRLASETGAVCFGSLAQRSPVSRATVNRFLDAIPDDGQTLKIFDINLRQYAPASYRQHRRQVQRPHVSVRPKDPYPHMRCGRKLCVHRR